MSPLSGNFREYMLTGGLFILSFVTLVLIELEGDIYSTICKEDFAKFCHSISEFRKFHSGIFMSTTIITIAIISITVGFLLELFGSFAFGVEVMALVKMLTKNSKFIKKNVLFVTQDMEYLSGYEKDNKLWWNLWKYREPARNLNLYLAIYCAGSISCTQKEFLIRSISTLRFARGMSWLAFHAIVINFLLVIDILREPFVVSIIYILVAFSVWMTLYVFVDKSIRDWDQLSKKCSIKERLWKMFLNFNILCNTVLCLFIILAIMIFAYSIMISIEIDPRMIDIDIDKYISLIFVSIFIIVLAYFTTKTAYENHIKTIFYLMHTQNRVRQDHLNSDSER